MRFQVVDEEFNGQTCYTMTKCKFSISFLNLYSLQCVGQVYTVVKYKRYSPVPSFGLQLLVWGSAVAVSCSVECSHCHYHRGKNTQRATGIEKYVCYWTQRTWHQRSGLRIVQWFCLISRLIVKLPNL